MYNEFERELISEELILECLFDKLFQEDDAEDDFGIEETRLNYTILENGLESTLYAAEFLELSKGEEVDKKKKNLKISLLLLSSGIELIFKSVLYMKYWKCVVDKKDLKKMKNDKTITDKIKNQIKEGTYQSINLYQIFERLKELVDINPKAIKKMRTLRNKVEHFRYNFDENVVSSSIEDALNSLIKIIANNYGELFFDNYREDEDGEYMGLGLTGEEAKLFEKLIVELIKIPSCKRNAAELAKEYAEWEYEDIRDCPICGTKKTFVKNKNGIGGHCIYCGKRYE